MECCPAAAGPLSTDVCAFIALNRLESIGCIRATTVFFSKTVNRV